MKNDLIMPNKFLLVITTHNFRLLYYLIRHGNLWRVIKIFLKNRFFSHNNRFISLEKCLSLFSKEPRKITITKSHPIDVIIPVYNGFDYLEKLFQSIFQNTHVPFRLIIIDDCSSDKRVFPYLEKINIENPDTTLLLQNSINKGFAGSVNLGFQYTDNHFVILNTDVEVPPSWLERLMAPIFLEDCIASTTPFSNAADIFSFPEFPENNPVFEGLDLQTLDSFFQYIHVDENVIEIPSGVGFCMGINKHIANKIGMFDREAFGLGYCEENDWCMRAIEHGFKNILVPNLFIYHKQGGSFLGKSKKKLIKKNYWRLVNRHKNYLPAIYEFIRMDPLKYLREFLILLILANTGASRPLLLIIGPSIPDRKKSFYKNFSEMRSDQKILNILYDNSQKKFLFKFDYKDYRLKFYFNNPSLLYKLFDWIPTEKIITNTQTIISNKNDIYTAICGLKKDIHIT